VAEFRPEDILRVLEEHEVRYVLIGGLAASLHGSPQVTFDVDITPERGRQNLERLSDALTELNARVNTADEPEGVPFGHDAGSLGSVEIWNLVTDFGNLDISFTPSGTGGFEDLNREAVRLNVLGVDAYVASLEDVIRSKEAAGRPQDQIALPVLRRILERGEP